jgi:hypothetical protein
MLLGLVEELILEELNLVEKVVAFIPVVVIIVRPRGFASDLEQGNSVGGDAKLIKVDNGGVNGSPAMPRCFRDQRMSEKLVVAVDVDEGMYAIVYEYACATLLIFYGMSSILYDLIFFYMNNEDLVLNLDYMLQFQYILNNSLSVCSHGSD